MARKFSLAYLTIPGTDPVKQIEIAAEAGYDYVSLRTISMHLPGEPIFEMESDPVLMKNTAAALKANNMSLYDIELARVADDIDESKYEAAFEKGAELGAQCVLSSIWKIDEANPLTIEKFGHVCDMAAKYKLKVSLEFVTFAGVTGLEGAVKVLKAVDRPNAGMLVDTLHAHRSRVSPADLAKVDPKYFHFIHLCDGPERIPPLGDPEMIGVAREARLYLGDGKIDIAGMVKAMPSDLVGSIELPNKVEMDKRGAAGHAAECLRKAKAYFEANGL